MNTLEQAKKELYEELRKIAIATVTPVFNKIINDTPKDTGLAKGNWQASINEPLTNKVALQAPIDVTPILSQWTLKDTAYLTNNVDYIEALEYGWSKQQPNGWVRRDVAQGQILLDEAVSKVGAK